MQKVIFLDIDGTLVDIQRGLYEPSVYTKHAIKKLIENGHLVFIASGRSKPTISKTITDLNPSGYVLSNGAYIEYNNQTLYEKYIDKENITGLLEFCKNNDCLFTGESNLGIYSPVNNDRFRKYLNLWNLNFVPISFDFGDGNFFKCNIDVPNTRFGHLLEEFLKGKLDCRCQTANNAKTTYDVNLIGVNKGSAADIVIKTLNIDRNNAYCFCDGSNDIELVKVCKNSYVMDNGDEDVKKVAFDICPGVLDDGVYKKLLELGLIDEYKG